MNCVSNENFDEFLERRKRDFDKFFAELVPVLYHFVEDSGVGNPLDVVNTPERLLDPLTKYLAKQKISEDISPWLHARLSYFIGEIFVHRYSGCWFVNESKTSRFSGRFVVGKFSRFSNQAILIDPSSVAHTFLESFPDKLLTDCVAEADSELRQANNAAT